MADIEKDTLQNQQEEELEIVENENDLTEDDDIEEDIPAHQEEPSDDDEDEREAIRERRRQEKKDRKERKDQAIKRDKLELDFLRKRNDDLERRLSAQEVRAHQGDLNAYDQAIAKAHQEAQMAEQVIEKAIEAQNGRDVAQAMRYRDQAKERIMQLKLEKQNISQPKQPQIDDMTLHYAKEFMNENPWYDANGGNEDSAIVIAIDQSLSNEGLDPRSEEYWSELRKRAARRIPERFTKKERVVRGGPAIGSGKEHAPTSTRNQIYISPERKQALIDAGVWDDPVLRMKYVKRYAEYDKNNKNS